MARYQPDEEQADLRRALAGRDENFYAAELELFLGGYFAQRGWTFDRHPTLSQTSRKPDYLVHTTAPRLDFIVEARASVDSTEVHRDRVMPQLRDAFDQIIGPEWVHLIIDGELPGDLSVRRAAAGLKSFIERSRAGGPRRETFFSHAGCSLIAEIATTQTSTGPVVGGWQYGEEAKTVQNAQPLLDAFRREASRYGETGLPYVVGLLGRREFPLHAHSVLSALYGTRQWDLNTSGLMPEFVGHWNKRDGAFTSLKDGRPIHTRVSAVAVYVRRDPGSGMEYHLSVFHNPFTTLPLPRDLFADCPQFVQVDASSEESTSMTWDGEPPAWW